MITCARDLSIYVSSGSSSSKYCKFVPGGNARSGPVYDGLTDEVSNPKVVQSPPAYPEDSVLSDQSERQIDDETSRYAGPEFCKLLDDGHPLYHFKRQMQLNSLVLLLVQLDCSTKLDHLPQTNPHEPHACTMHCLLLFQLQCLYMFVGSTVGTFQGLLQFPRILVVQLGLGRSGAIYDV